VESRPLSGPGKSECVGRSKSWFMKVSGFTFCRNIIRYDYPIIESIRSILPIVDELIVNVGRGEDGTLELVQSIGDPKIRIIESVWDESCRTGGLVYAQQTNIALAACTGDWAFYIQADEVIHEDDLPKIYKAMHDNLGKTEVLGLLFRYLHFVGDYWSVNPWHYHRAVRVIRNNGELESCGDAVGFSRKGDGKYLQSGPSCWLAQSNARVFHYGWVKNRQVMLAKRREQLKIYYGNAPSEDLTKMLEQERLDLELESYQMLKNYGGAHPKVMQGRVDNAARLAPGRNRWLNWRFYREVARRGFRG
jgi:glycosyltransferase involved in cell wall biosynthesis